MDILISNASPEPIYEQIVKQIKKQIVSGALKDGAPLPSIRALARDLQISVITTKRAYEELEREGLIETVGGKGSFVAAKNRELLLEKGRSMLEEKLHQVVLEAKSLGIDCREVHRMLDLIYKGE